VIAYGRRGKTRTTLQEFALDTRCVQDIVRALLTGLALSLAGIATASHSEAGRANYSPYVNIDFPRNLYWGDTHVHTNLSADAYGFSNRLTSDDAFRFAEGATVISNTGQPVRLSRPLDFLAVTDHAEYLGVSAMLDHQGDELAYSEIGRRWLQLLKGGKRQQILVASQQVSSGTMKLSHDPAVARTVWQQVAETADRYNEPGRFTAFIGYEWSALPDGNNLHRNVIFRDGADTVTGALPFSAVDSRNPEDLWRYLEHYERITGGRALAIPHNANVSNGLMFSNKTYNGDPMTTAYATTRVRWEPVIEVTQIKGDGETHPYLSPEDEFADFETWDAGNFALPRAPKENWMLQHEYARSALKNGLAAEEAIGANPFRFGMIGSSDTHIALSAVEENNYFGKFALDEPSAGRAFSEPMPAARYAASGYAAVWARENTRESIFDAFQRREVYATTGPRIVVRFFGGWDFDDQDALRPDYAAIGYREGVPMGGDLGPAPAGDAPRFLILAGKDPMGANLDRAQVVKGWLDRNGSLREKVYNVALSGNRSFDANGRVAAIRSSVDIKSATYTNTVGESQLATVWQDPDFSANERAFYYVRVLEIPTPRWTAYDAAFYGTELPKTVPAEIQERAYTSPIWYSPR